MKLAVKRLSSVEVAPRATAERIASRQARSNQHELNANRLRKSLGFSERTTEGAFRVLFFLEDGEQPVTDESTYTLYNAREGKPRSAEYRLYYHSTRITELARADDLLVLFRPDHGYDLVAVFARAGTSTEAELLKALELDPASALRQFVFRDPTRVEAAGIDSLARTGTIAEHASPAVEHPLLHSATQAGAVPRAELISAAANQSVVGRFGDLDADRFIFESLREESELYFAIEAAVKERQLADMIRKGEATLPNILKFSLSVHQSRKSRRGQSLQYHFEALLSRHEIPFTPQCVTENGERPDIVVPGKPQYDDAKFPAELLRMVACKSTVRERWSQLTREADRIDEKYLLTVDADMSSDVIGNMAQHHRLLPFVPESVRVENYSTNPWVRNVTQLLTLLRAVIDEARRRGVLRRHG